MKLAEVALKQIPILREWLKSAEKKLKFPQLSEDINISELKRKYHTLKRRLEDYDDMHSNISNPTSYDAKLQYLRDERLGFFAYTSAILCNQDREGYIEEIEMDFRKLPTVSQNFISLSVGEIKSGTGKYEFAIYQVVRRLGVLYMAGRHSLDTCEANYSFIGIGEIISPNADWKDPSKKDIEKHMDEAGIVEYPPTLQITVDVIA